MTATQERPNTPAARKKPNAVLAFARNTWRGLTSMRTALILLFLLAVASLPGALLPQWSLNRAKTSGYIAEHPFWGPWLNRLGFFEVFASPWYSAVYLLLFISLVGCLLPRSWEFVGQLRARPVNTPRNLARMPLHERYDLDGDDDTAEQATDRVETALRARHWRVARRTEADGRVSISAEKGYLRELGNLVFHFSLLGLLIAIAVGKLFGYEGSVIKAVGSDMCSSSPVQYDNFRPGLMIDGTEMSPFCLQIKSFQADWADNGQALDFSTDVDYQSGAEAGTDSWHPATIAINEPLRLDGERVYVLGHGYSPTVQIVFPNGESRDYTAPFISNNDPGLLSTGVIKVLDPPGVAAADLPEHQLAISGLFAPTAAEHGGIMTSVFPAANNPGLAVRIYRGDLGMESGVAQSVFEINQDMVDTGALVQQESVNLYVGDSTTLDDGTTITFTGYTDWVSLQTSYDPGQFWALVFAVTLLLGLMTSLIIKRRRVWFRLTPIDGPGEVRRIVVDAGGLARTDQAGYGAEFAELSELARPARVEE